MTTNSLKATTNTVTTTTVSSEQYNLVKSIAAKGATDTEFQLLVHIANKYDLDPLLKEIWCIKRTSNDPAIIMTSRDGYLKIAHRSGQLNGLQSGTVEDENGRLIKAWCEVWRKDMDHSFKAEVKYSEYKNGSPTWTKYPSAMLIKVAEVFALKRAFSISGMVTQEELETEDDESKSKGDKKGIAPITPSDPVLEAAFNNLVNDIGAVSNNEELDKLSPRIDMAVKVLRPEQADAIIEWVDQKKEELNA